MTESVVMVEGAYHYAFIDTLIVYTVAYNFTFGKLIMKKNG